MLSQQNFSKIEILLLFYRILYADVGVNGRISDGGVWNRCTLKSKVFDNSLNIPDVDRIPLHIVGDDAFPLSTRIMKPYSLAELQNDKEKRIFNYSLNMKYEINSTSENDILLKSQLII